MEQSLTLLKTHGLKATPQRIAIYNYLRHTTAHPTVETIYASLHPANPTMSLATVYMWERTASATMRLLLPTPISNVSAVNRCLTWMWMW